MVDVSPQLKNQLVQFQQLQGQLQAIANQRMQVELQLKDIESTLEELGKFSDSAELYKNVGSLLVKAEGKDWTFKVDKSTVLTERGAGKAQAKAEAAGQAGVKFADFVKPGMGVEMLEVPQACRDYLASL